MSHHPDCGSAAPSPPHEEGSIHGAESLSCKSALGNRPLRPWLSSYAATAAITLGPLGDCQLPLARLFLMCVQFCTVLSHGFSDNCCAVGGSTPMSSATHLADKTLTFILAGGEAKDLYPLSAAQPKSALPFGGVFRIIDFTLSNVLNSGLRRIYVLTQYKQDRLHAYVRAGWQQLWDEFRWEREDAITCLPPTSGKRYRGTADALFQNLHVLEKSTAEYVLIVSGDQIYQMDYGKLLQLHCASGVDLTIAGIPNANSALVNMGVYVVGKKLLVDALHHNADFSEGSDFAKDLLPVLIRSSRAGVFEFAGYWRDLGTLDLYYQTNLDLLTAGTPFHPYENTAWPTRTLAGPKSVQRSWMASQSRVSVDAELGVCEVRMSIVSTGARIDEGAELEAAIILPGAHIGSGASIRKTIVSE